MKIKKVDFINRQLLKDNPNWLFLFGDNLEEKGYGGQAKEMRGEPNAIGIPTKVKPDMSEDSFFNDNDFNEVKKIYDFDFDLINELMMGKYDMIVIPSSGLGTGLAKLNINAPKIFEYLNMKLNELEEK